MGYYSLIPLPLGHGASAYALEQAAQSGAMKRLTGRYKDVRAARVRTKVGELDCTLICVESRELLEGQKRGIAVALGKAEQELGRLERLVQAGRIRRSSLEQRVRKALGREHLASFVVTEIGGTGKSPTFSWRVDFERRTLLEQTRLGRRVLCTDRHSWPVERIVHAFRGQWSVEELFRRSKKGGVVPWGPSFQRADSSLRLHTFATMIGLMLVSLAKIALGTEAWASAMMQSLGHPRDAGAHDDRRQGAGRPCRWPHRRGPQRGEPRLHGPPRRQPWRRTPWRRKTGLNPTPGY